MRAILVDEFGGPEVLRLRQIPDPTVGPKEILVRVHAAGVNPVETYVRAGTYASLPTLPYIPGLEGAGEVLALGDKVTRFKVGDRVYFLGAPSYAELARVPEAAAHPLPEGVTYEQGAAIGLAYGTAHRSLFGLGRAKSGERLLVHGASGGVGTAALQLGRAAGLEVFGTAGSAQGLRHVEEQGAAAFGHDAYSALMEATSGHGLDLILELAAHQNLGQDLDILAPRGRVVVAGSRGPVEINPRALMLRDASVLGMLYQNTPAEEEAALYTSIGDGLRGGELRPVVGRRYPLSEAAKAHESLFAPGALGKVILIV